MVLLFFCTPWWNCFTNTEMLISAFCLWFRLITFSFCFFIINQSMEELDWHQCQTFTKTWSKTLETMLSKPHWADDWWSLYKTCQVIGWSDTLAIRGEPSVRRHFPLSISKNFSLKRTITCINPRSGWQRSCGGSTLGRVPGMAHKIVSDNSQRIRTRRATNWLVDARQGEKTSFD